MSCEFFGTCTISTLIGSWQTIDVSPKETPHTSLQSSDQGGDDSSSLDNDQSDEESSESVYCDDVASEDESSEEVTSDQ